MFGRVDRITLIWSDTPLPVSMNRIAGGEPVSRFVVGVVQEVLRDIRSAVSLCCERRCNGSLYWITRMTCTFDIHERHLHNSQSRRTSQSSKKHSLFSQKSYQRLYTQTIKADRNSATKLHQSRNSYNRHPQRNFVKNKVCAIAVNIQEDPIAPRET